MKNNPSYFKNCGDDCPVEQVSWDDAQEFIRKLNERERISKYRLLTEAEWEYACRAGSTKEFCFGDNTSKLEEYGWFDKNSEGRIHSVGQLKPNAWGLYDMHGNVWEWCQDWYGPYAAEPAIDPKGPDAGRSRVLRGGSWDNDICYVRAAGRLHLDPAFRDVNIGFRVARTLELPLSP